MNIAIQAADLDHARIDGTRVYIKELLARFGAQAPQHDFHLYHRHAWNPELAPPRFPNYHEHTLAAPAYWTQTRFLVEMFRARPDVLWMPMQSLPFVRPRDMRTVVTIHDLAFKIFPSSFPARDRRRLNLFTDFAVRHADALIAVSHATKNDLLTFYPSVAPENITVVHHGFSTQMFAQPVTAQEHAGVREKYGITAAPYILYVGALQPRKNLVTLVRAFERYAAANSEVQLVLAGGKGWMWEPLMTAVQQSPYRARIVLTGRVSFADLRVLYADARVFAFPSLYEGFGIPLLEAFAAGVPVVTADNSSLPEVAGGASFDDGAAALMCDAGDVGTLAAHLQHAVEDEAVRTELIARGRARLGHFSWDTCARQTLAIFENL